MFRPAATRSALVKMVAKRAFATVMTFCILAFTAVKADAGTIVDNPGSSMFQKGSITQLKLSDFENVLDPRGNIIAPGSPIEPGDTFQGMFLITTSQTPGGSNQLSPGDFQLAGVFQTLIEAVTPNVNSNGDSAFKLVPYPPFATQFRLPAGAMCAIWDGPANTFDAAAGSWQAAEATATQGTLWQVGGAAPGSVWGSDYYWASVGSSNPGSSSFTASLQLLYNGTGIPTSSFADLTQQAPASYPGGISLVNILNPLAFQGITYLNTYSGIPFQIASQDPLQENVVPEPSSLVLAGALIGVLAVVGRHRRKVRR
jgi:hypothetical protein